MRLLLPLLSSLIVLDLALDATAALSTSRIVLVALVSSLFNVLLINDDDDIVHGAPSSSSSSSTSLVASPPFSICWISKIVHIKCIVIIRGVLNSKFEFLHGKVEKFRLTTTTTTTKKRWEDYKEQKAHDRHWSQHDTGHGDGCGTKYNLWFTDMMWSKSSRYFTRLRLKTQKRDAVLKRSFIFEAILVQKTFFGQQNKF